MKIKTILALGASLAALTAPGLAAAAGPAFQPQAQESRIGIAIDWLNTERGSYYHNNIVTCDLTAQIGVTEKVFLDVDIPWAFLDVGYGLNNAYFGNPWGGVHYAETVSEHMSFYIGGGLGLPVNAERDATDSGVLSLVNQVRAYDGRARFVARALPLTGRGGIELSWAPLFMRFDLTPTLFVPLRDGPSTQLQVDHAFEIGGRGSSGFLGGARLQGNLLLTATPDHAQFAIEPFFGYEAKGSGLFVRLGFLVALDDGLGFGFDAGKIRTLRFAIGGKF